MKHKTEASTFNKGQENKETADYRPESSAQEKWTSVKLDGWLGFSTFSFST